MADLDFLTTYTPLANDIAQRTHVDPSVILGIIDQETGGGKHVLGNNIFGISPSGPRGQYVAQYPDVQTAAEAFISTLQKPVYKGVTATADPDAQARALGDAGYGPNKAYGGLIVQKAAAIRKQVGGYEDTAASAPEAGPTVKRVLDDPALQGGDTATTAAPPSTIVVPPGTAPAAPKTAVDRVLADSALQSSEAPAKPPEPPSAPDMPMVDEYGRPVGPDTPEVRGAQASGAGGRIAQAGIEAAKAPGPDVFGPASGFWQQLNPGINALAAPFRAVGAAGLQSIYEAGEPIGNAINIPTPWGTIGGPGLGGDLVTMATVAPAAEMEVSAFRPRNMLEPPQTATTPTGQTVTIPRDLSPPEPTYVSPPEGGNLLSQKAAEYAPPRVSPPPSSVIPEEPPATPLPSAVPAETRAWVSNTARDIDALIKENAAAGGPGSLSAAATPPADAAMSPRLAKAYRRMSEVNQVVSPIEGPDFSTYVEGSVPTRAEGLGNPAESQREVMARNANPEPFTGEQGRLTQNNAARIRKYDDLTPSDPQIATIEEDQAKAAQAAEQRIKANAQPVDAQGIADHVNGLLSDPRLQERTDVVKVIKPIRDALYDAEGKLKTDPMAYWGIHDDLMAKLAKAKDPLNASSSEKFAFDQINGVKKLVDEALSNATGGEFGKFLEEQSGFFQQLNAAKILRDFRTKMVNKDGNIYADRFHKFVTDLAVRRGKPGVDAAMDIPDETMQGLININQDLKRASRIDLGKPRGSPTNLYSELAKGLGIAGAHAAVTAMGGGPILNVGLQTGMSGLQRMIARARLSRLTESALNPPEASQPQPISAAERRLRDQLGMP